MHQFFQTLSDRIKLNKPTVLVTIIKTRGATPGRVGFHMLVGEEGRIIGTVGGGAVEFHALNQCSEFLKGDERFLNETIVLVDDENVKNSSGKGEVKIVLPAWCGGEVELYYELFRSDRILYIYGAGHVGAEVAALALRQGFFVEIFDDRKEILNTLPENTYSCKHLIQYPPADFNVQLNPKGYVVILTQSHKHDLPVLDYLLNQYPELKYIGMIGSTLKVKECIINLKQKYGNKFSLNNLYAPIGINIGGDTPSEIAISIVAELFSILHNKEAKHMRLNYSDIKP